MARACEHSAAPVESASYCSSLVRAWRAGHAGAHCEQEHTHALHASTHERGCPFLKRDCMAFRISFLFVSVSSFAHSSHALLFNHDNGHCNDRDHDLCHGQNRKKTLLLVVMMVVVALPMMACMMMLMIMLMIMMTMMMVVASSPNVRVCQHSQCRISHQLCAKKRIRCCGQGITDVCVCDDAQQNGMCHASSRYDDNCLIPHAAEIMLQARLS